MKPGPRETKTGTIYAFSHQAYWGLRFLAERRPALWEQIQSASTVDQILTVGKQCSNPRTLTGAGYGAAGMLERLAQVEVAVQILVAKKHRRFPSSKRPTSQDRRMICLGVAMAAGFLGVEYSTAHRKLASARRGIKYLNKDVHAHDRFQQFLKDGGFIWAEPVGNYFFETADGKWTPMHDLPCQVPSDWFGGYIIFGHTENGFQAAFSRTLPMELQDTDDPMGGDEDVGGPPTPQRSRKALREHQRFVDRKRK